MKKKRYIKTGNLRHDTKSIKSILDADQTYLIMKVRQMIANIDIIEKILKNERTNKRTSKRIEQKFMKNIENDSKN